MKHSCPTLCPRKWSNKIRNRGKFSNRKGKQNKAPKGESIYERTKFSNSLKTKEILIYTRNSYPWQHRTEYPALHILELQFRNAKSKNKAARGKITIAQQINSSNFSLGPGAARFARYKARKGQLRAAVTANRPLSRRPRPRSPPGRHHAGIERPGAQPPLTPESTAPPPLPGVLHGDNSRSSSPNLSLGSRGRKGASGAGFGRCIRNNVSIQVEGHNNFQELLLIGEDRKITL